MADSSTARSTGRTVRQPWQVLGAPEASDLHGATPNSSEFDHVDNLIREGDYASAKAQLDRIQEGWAHSGDSIDREKLAQAGFWRSRLSRDPETHPSDNPTLRQFISDFGSDPAPGGRIWVAHVLMHYWLDNADTQADWTDFDRCFTHLFGEDEAPEIRRIDAQRRMLQGLRNRRLHGQQTANMTLTKLIERYREDTDPIIAMHVELARQLLDPS